jgi:hypothetical protein
MSTEQKSNDNNEKGHSFILCDDNVGCYPFLESKDYNGFDFDKTEGFVKHKPVHIPIVEWGFYPSDAIIWLQTREDANRVHLLNLTQKLCDDLYKRMMSAHKRITSNSFRNAHGTSGFVKLIFNDLDKVDAYGNHVRCVFQFKMPVLVSKIEMMKSLKMISKSMKALADTSLCPNGNCPDLVIVY